ncbi:GTP-binding protein [Apostasia shenzhenica]|uniref:GTP-binding protein n=1 Tax=Apostasia shenzhenica TaxID=1088818 RepID=A0A2I0AMT3_9ASPA|nr:GTP-binding protein [Apostasia shenzhenica]
MVVRYHHHRVIPRCFSISTSTPRSTWPSRFFFSSFSSTSPAPVLTETYHHTVSDRPKLFAHPSSLLPSEPRIEIPLEKLFVPPEVELPTASSVSSARVLKGSNIVLGHYARDAPVCTAEFVKSSTRTEDCPADGLPEFALVGRSNVGKSSLLNSLVRRKRLALTSKKPGGSLSLTLRSAILFISCSKNFVE